MLNIVFHVACVLSGVVDLAVSKTICFYSNNENGRSLYEVFLKARSHLTLYLHGLSEVTGHAEPRTDGLKASELKYLDRYV